MPKKKIQFGEEKLPNAAEFAEKMKELNRKSGCRDIRIDSVCEGRVVAPDDFDRWEQQRRARKAKNNTLDPYR